MNNIANKENSSTLLSLMLSVKRAIQEEARRSMSGLPKCSFMQFETLAYVKEKKDPLTSDIARHFLITPPAATFLTNGLVKTALLARKFDTKDRRTVRLEITRKGEAMLHDNIRERKGVFKKVFSVLNAKERTELAKILKKVANRTL